MTMSRRSFVSSLMALAAGGLSACVQADEDKALPLKKSDAEWKSLLPEDAYAVLFKEDTERPYSSPLNDEKRAGQFICAACYQPLFESAKKAGPVSGSRCRALWPPRRITNWCCHARSITARAAADIRDMCLKTVPSRQA